MPAHLQGEISGSAVSFSSPKQILQTLPSIANFACSASFNFNLCFYCLLLFTLLCYSLFSFDAVYSFSFTLLYGYVES